MSQIERYHGQTIQPTEKLFTVSESQIREMQRNQNGAKVLCFVVSVVAVVTVLCLAAAILQGDKVIVIQGDGTSRVVRY